MVSEKVRSSPGPGLSWKLGAAICHYVVRDTMLANNMFRVELGQLQQIHILPSQQVDCYLCQWVYDD